LNCIRLAFIEFYIQYQIKSITHHIPSVPPAVVAADTVEYNADLELAAARSSGIASNAFPARDNHGVVPLSLPPEGFFPSYESLKNAACKYAKLAGWAIVEGKGSKWVCGKRVKYLTCKHAYKHDKRTTPNEADRKKDRMSKKTDCPVRMKINERPDGSWQLRWMEDRCQHNHDVHDPASYH